MVRLMRTARATWGGVALLIAVGVAGLLCCLAPGVGSGQPSRVAPPGKADLLLPVLNSPPSDSGSCKVAHELAGRLLKELESQVDPVLRAAAEKYVSGRNSACPIGKAWDDFGLAMLMQGDALAASWCGLNAIGRQWTGQLVTNCAVYLVYLGRSNDALPLLNCAYASGYRSPYLFEALANVYRKKGNKEKTIQWIELAKAEAPDDIMVHVEHSLAKMGAAPPSSPPAAKGTDELDQAVAELEKHAQRVLQAIQELAARLDQIEEDPRPKQFRDQLLAIQSQSIQREVDNARNAVKRARMTPEEFQKTVGAKAGAFSRDSYKRYMGIMYNQAVLSSIEHYYFVTEHLLRTLSGQDVDGPGWHAMFWADVLYTDPVTLEEEQKLRWDDMRHRHEISSDEKASWGRLDHHAWMYYYKAFWESDDQRRKDREGCKGIKDAEAQKACYTKAEMAHCSRVRAAYEAMAQEAQERYDGSAHHFDLVARDTMMWGEKQLNDFRNYALRYFKLLKLGTINTSKMAGPPVTEAQMYSRMLNTWWNFLRDEVIKMDHPTHSLAKYLRNEAEWFGRDRQRALDDLAREKGAIETGSGGSVGTTAGCAAVEKRYLDLLAQEAWQEYLKQLQDNLKSDLQAKYDPTAACDGTIGPLSFSIDDTGKSTGTFKVKDKLGEEIDLKRKLSIKDADFAGAAVAAGSGWQGTVINAKAEGSLFMEKNKRTGKWDGGFGISGALGVGYKYEKTIFGQKVGLGLACYPGSVSAKFYARAAFDDAVALVRAAINR